MASSLARLATVSASTKRATFSSGRRSAPTEQISSLDVTPLDPVSAELAQRLGLDTPHEVLQTFCEGDLDLQEGDILVVGTEEYPIRALEEWTYGDTTSYRLVVEELKR